MYYLAKTKDSTLFYATFSAMYEINKNQNVDTSLYDSSEFAIKQKTHKFKRITRNQYFTLVKKAIALIGK